MVKAWREMVTIPTYEVGKAEKNPVFLENRVYQGSSGAVYPYPVIESISDEKVDRDYMAVWLENEYVKVMILPELGGRVQMAYDKIKRRHFVYYNHVIKPALVGLAGPWISGGIEFNWPQHHRPSTFMPVDCTIEEGDDGSMTVWVSEMERMTHQKGMAGFTLRPGCACLEIRGVLYNRTDVPQTFLWWANPAVEVNNEYQSVFPPDINAVFDHGKRAVSSFPIATGTYYKMDYSAGVDISNYKNIAVPTSYMGVNSRFDFEGGYENDTQAGMLHVASHHFSPGKKQWTWGNGDFGRAWDRNLTDEAPMTPPEGGWKGEVDDYTFSPKPTEKQQEGVFRPYIELMAGVYTENQPDFTWLMPYEEKQFVQYFMPYRELGVVKVASKDLIFNINEVGESMVEFKIFATSKQQVRIVLVTDSGEVLYDKWHVVSPEGSDEHQPTGDEHQPSVLTQRVDTRGAAFNTLNLKVLKTLYGTERVVMQWHAESDEIRPIPDSAEAALLPEQVKTNEQLFLTGQHLEQYRHATWSPVDYYEEALRRDPNDVRCLNALGLWYIRKGRYARAEDYLRKAVKLITKRNPNPYDSEPIYNLALALKYQGQPDEAYELFWKATWSKAWADAGYFEAAKISVAQGRLNDALDELNRGLVYGAHNQKAIALKAAVLRKMGRKESAMEVCRQALKTDLFNYVCRYEMYLLTGDQRVVDEMKQLLQGPAKRSALGTLCSAKNYDEVALEYCAAGLNDEARAIWDIAIDEGATTPMTYYYLGRYQEAEQASPDYCFPNRAEDIIALETAKRMNPEGAKAPYYLGCLYYAARQYDLAIENWERSAKLDALFPTVWRNLALARFNKRSSESNGACTDCRVATFVGKANNQGSESNGACTDCRVATFVGKANKQSSEQEALEYMERAFHLDENDERVLMELDQLYRRLQKPHAERLAFLQQHSQLVERRDDLVLEEITLLNQTGRYEEAMQKLDSHRFHPWEGGEGKVPTQYQICRVELAKQAVSQQRYSEAKALLEQCLDYPVHLGEGKLYGAQENDFYYLLGCVNEALGETEKARECWEKATKGPQEPAAAMYYNDAKPDKIFYQGLALLKLGRKGEANGRFYRLVNYGRQHIFDHVVMDYFAVSLPDMLIWEEGGESRHSCGESRHSCGEPKYSSLDRKNEIHCKYMLALGYYGLGDKRRAEHWLAEVERLDINHYGTQALRSLMKLFEQMFR